MPSMGCSSRSNGSAGEELSPRRRFGLFLAERPTMALGATLDAVHALLMVAWLIGLPLLFWRRWPTLTRMYGIYAVVFVVVSQVSHHLLGECFLTTLSRHLWKVSASRVPQGADEWFTVRFAEFVFHLTPSHRAIVLGWEAFTLLTAVGVLLSLRQRSRETRASRPAG